MVAGGWGSYSGGWENEDATDDNSITITDNGTYTIHVNSGEAGELGESQWAMALRSTNFNAFIYGEEGDDFNTCLEKGGVTVTIDSVKINGVEKLTGESVMRNDDDGNNIRVNIYNQWTSPKAAIVDGSQVFDGDVEVTFTVDGLVFGLQEVTYGYGDVNGDNVVDARDASDVLAEYAALQTNKPSTLNEAQSKAANINNDDSVDARDASIILSYYAYTQTHENPDDINKWLSVNA